jgi:hypothetical protein
MGGIGGRAASEGIGADEYGAEAGDDGEAGGVEEEEDADPAGFGRTPGFAEAAAVGGELELSPMSPDGGGVVTAALAGVDPDRIPQQRNLSFAAPGMADAE